MAAVGAGGGSFGIRTMLCGAEGGLGGRGYGDEFAGSAVRKPLSIGFTPTGSRRSELCLRPEDVWDEGLESLSIVREFGGRFEHDGAGACYVACRIVFEIALCRLSRVDRVGDGADGSDDAVGRLLRLAGCGPEAGPSIGGAIPSNPSVRTSSVTCPVLSSTAASRRGSGGRSALGTATGTMPQLSNSACAFCTERNNAEELHGFEAARQRCVEDRDARCVGGHSFDDQPKDDFSMGAPPSTLLQPLRRRVHATVALPGTCSFRSSADQPGSLLVSRVDAVEPAGGALPGQPQLDVR